MSAKELRQELIDGKAGTQFKETLNLGTVKKTLGNLQRTGMVNSSTLMKDNDDPGPAPNGYRFSADAPIVTLRATAAIIMKLHNHPEQRVTKNNFIREVSHLRLGHNSSQQPFTDQDIEDQLAYCLRKGYIQEIEVEVGEAGTPTKETRLCVTGKVDEHRMFLDKIAGEVKLQAVTEPGPSESPGSETSRAG